MANIDFQVIHEGDQERAESLALGDIHIVGQDEEGKDLLQLTSKGFTRSLDRSHIAPVTTREELIYLLSRAAELEHLSRATLRLMTTVIRPLSEALTKLPVDRHRLPGRTAGPGFGYNRDIHLLPHKPSAWVFFGERLWQLAVAATKLCLNPSMPTEIQEAAAALQDLACQFAPLDGPRGVAAKVAELKLMQAELGRSIQASLNGPYLVTNADALVNWLGERIPARPQMALCRCGGSAIKPFCDGTHARIGFTGKKEPDRVPDRRDTYVGKQITIFDNRGICQHSGFCIWRVIVAHLFWHNSVTIQ